MLLREHASNYLPSAYDHLRLSSEQLHRHTAWDIGAEKVMRPQLPHRSHTALRTTVLLAQLRTLVCAL